MPPAAFSPLGRAHALLHTLRSSKRLRPSLREALYGVYSSLFEKLRKTGVEGHRETSAAQRTDFLRTLPPTPQTSMKNLAAGLLTADLPASSRWCVPPQPRSFTFWRVPSCTPV